jgi:hypothetical protein
MMPQDETSKNRPVRGGFRDGDRVREVSGRGESEAVLPLAKAEKTVPLLTKSLYNSDG